MRLKKNLAGLYKEYKRIQGDTPISLGDVGSNLKCYRYGERAMRQIVGLLSQIEEECHITRDEFCSSYMVRIMFQWIHKEVDGPIAIIVKLDGEVPIDILCWNGGNICHATYEQLEFIAGAYGNELHRECDVEICQRGIAITNHGSKLCVLHEKWMSNELSGKNTHLYRKG